MAVNIPLSNDVLSIYWYVYWRVCDVMNNVTIIRLYRTSFRLCLYNQKRGATLLSDEQRHLLVCDVSPNRCAEKYKNVTKLLTELFFMHFNCNFLRGWQQKKNIEDKYDNYPGQLSFLSFDIFERHTRCGKAKFVAWQIHINFCAVEVDASHGSRQKLLQSTWKKTINKKWSSNQNDIVLTII